MQTASAPVSEASEILRPFVPRLVITWLRETPATLHRRIDGTLAFVDISGFTKMTERLARKGKVGAEEVSDVLDLCFSQLLGVAYEFNGGVIKWGGDAVTLLFDGPGHPERAARAAWRMQRTLRQLSRLRTSAGLVSLRMSVGIHSGEFDFFLVGRRHRELIAVGPGVSRTVEMESTAEAGDVLLSPESAARLDPSVLGAAKGPGILLRTEPQASPVRAQPIEAGSLDLRVAVPADIRNYLLAGGGHTEHRHITVAFVQFRRIDDLIRTDPGRATEVIERFLVDVEEAAEEHGVSFHETDIDADGGKILLVAGAPHASDNDEERMLRAARAIIEAPTQLSVRIGINSGYVFTGDLGPPYRRTYSIKGDAVNLAARIMGKAGPGQILTMASVLDRSPTWFDVTALEPFMVKGKKDPVQAFAVGPILGTRVREARVELPLVGRDEEMRTLLAALDEARAGRGRVVEVVGEPGIGKTRLLDEVVRRAGDANVVLGRCDPYEASTPYFAFRGPLRELVGIPAAGGDEAGEALRETLAARAPDLLPWVPLLAIPMDVEVPMTPETEHLEDRFKKERLEQATSELIARLLPGPTVLRFEDVHWIDEASSQLLERLMADAAERPWLVLVARRDVESRLRVPEAATVTTLRPAALRPEDAAALASAATEDSALPPHAVAMIADRSGGNPLLLQELVLASDGEHDVEALPDTIEALLSAQIDRLAAPDRLLLRYASVLGTAFSARLLHESLAGARGVADDPETWRRLADFVRDDGTGTFRFRHALIRDVAYEGLPYRRRRELHEAVGSTIERSPDVAGESRSELLSYHFFHAGRFDRAWEHSRTAGRRAQAKFAIVEAATFYRRALEAARALPGIPPREVADVSEALGDVLERAGLYAEASSAYRSARRLVGDDALAVAALLLKEGIVRERWRGYSQAMGWYRRGLRLLEPLGPDPAVRSTRAQLCVWYAAARRQQGRLRDCIDWCMRAIEEAESSGEREALAHAYRLLDWAYTELGSPESARYRGLALPIYEELGDLVGQSNVLNNLGMNAYFEGRWDEARDLYQRGLEARKKTGDAVNSAHFTNNIAEILSDQGKLEEAEVLFREALRVWRAAGFRLGHAFATSNLGRVAARAGRHDEASERYREAVAEFREIGAEGQALETEARMAENLVLAGCPERALPLVESTLAAVRGRGGSSVLLAMLHRLRGYSLAAGGKPEAARAALEESLRVAESVEAEYEVALTLEALARLAHLTGDPAAPDLEGRALDAFERLGVLRTPAVAIAPGSGARGGGGLQESPRTR